MSGFEVVSVVFGVLPVLIEAVKAYSSVSESLHTFRHYSKEIKAIRVQFKVHHGIFLNEGRLLLRLVGDERAAKDMLDDAADTRWKSKELNDRFNTALKDNFELCRSIIEASKDIADGLIEELRKFDILVERKAQGESIKAAIRRLRNAVRVCIDKSKYEKSLASLRDRNNDLGQLRGQMGQFQQQRACGEGTAIAKNVLPSSINAIRTASLKLHEAISAAWCCGDLKHGGHHAKLCLDAEANAEVQLDLAISCQGLSQQQDSRRPSDPPIWLCVQSISIDEVKCAQNGPDRTDNRANKRSLEEDTPEPCVTDQNRDTPPSLTKVVAFKKMMKRVRFLAPDSQDSVTSPAAHLSSDNHTVISETVRQQTSSHINLCLTKNICHYLKQNLQICGTPLTKHCVGYLESPKMYRHMFYLQEQPVPDRLKLKGSEQASVFSVIDLMNQGTEEALTVVDQLKLAHKAALAILQFNGTPWLTHRWRLADVGYFGTCETVNEDVLKTLHLSSQLSSGAKSISADMDGIEQTVQQFSEADYFGINNTTLFFLGVALLELAHWKPLEALRTEQDPNEIMTARRLASRPTPLGPRYQEVLRKCLQCNFGFGTDLNKKELQAAVYGDVVCQLEKMIKTLSI